MSAVRLAFVPLSLLLLSGCWQFRGPPKDGECRGLLRTALALELGLFDEQHRYSLHPAEVGFSPTAGNRYLYLFAAEGDVTRRDGLKGPSPSDSVGIGPDTRERGITAEWILARFPKDLRGDLGVHGECPKCAITLACAGNIDDDETLDVWSISSEDRPFVPRGTAFRHIDDRNQ